ncbi:MAG: HAMP domain-containing sensor histidine kinase [Campylobacterota bacterium]|nr:HAMP domain-containing sensor histidine kinase [Campylobacterota bacterium]
MPHESTDELINEIIQLSKLTRTGLDKKIEKFMRRYEREKKQYNLFLEQSDKRQVQMRKVQTEKEKMLEQQAKMAAMGEMMDAVAHQWKQPLNAISMMSDLLRSDFADGNVDQAYIDDAADTIQQQIEHMVTTLNEFRTFFRPNKEAEPFGLKRSLRGVQLLVKDEFLKNGITIHIESHDELIFNGIENEFKHVVLNIINNAKDAFNERKCDKRDIYVRFNKKEANIKVEIEDNAGGIPEHLLDHIFKPNITTKSEGKGTGIGLYMSSQIVEKHQGLLRVKNTPHGALFTITLPIT